MFPSTDLLLALLFAAPVVLLLHVVRVTFAPARREHYRRCSNLIFEDDQMDARTIRADRHRSGHSRHDV
jgi:cytochrome c-type biogenesis protein CcmH/NrfF